MTWNFHRYYSDSTDGLINKLKLTDEQNNMLKGLRSRVRTRTKEVFEEAKELAKASRTTLSLEGLTAQFANTRIKHLDHIAQAEVAQLIKNMDEEAHNAFQSLTPRFWTQGSFQYNTLNQPYFTPPQEMDIDDGTYLPMAFFEDKPIIGHRLLLLLVDSSLKSLVSENIGWKFEAKDTCARLKIPKMNTHIDVPMYAVPEDQFIQKEAALTKSLAMDAMYSVENFWEARTHNRAEYTLDSNCVNLAVREGGHKWIKSDPKIVEDWFNESCHRIGSHLREICRFVKSWRDAQWKKGGGPSSISLMAATVSILDQISHDKNDLGATMKIVIRHLPGEFSNGVESPDHTDEKPLFPPSDKHGVYEKKIMEKLHELNSIIDKAEGSSTKEQALNFINQAFGDRVIKSDLIVRTQSAPAFISEPIAGKQAARISGTMASG